MADQEFEEEELIEEEEELIEDEEVEDGDSPEDEEDYELELSDGSTLKASELEGKLRRLAELENSQGDYNKLLEVVRSYDELFNSINGDELIQDVMEYYRRGYSPKAIAANLAKLDKYMEKQEQFDTIEQEVEYHVKRRTEELERKFEELRRTEQIREMPNYNGNMLWAVAREELSPQEYASDEFMNLMKEANKKYNGGRDLRVNPLDPSTSAAIVNYALARYKRAPAKPAVKASARAATLPRRIPASASGKQKVVRGRFSDETSYSDKERILRDL